MTEFRERLKELRMAQNLTQSELAEKINLNSTTISAYERGSRKPSFDALDELADKLDVDVNYLLGNSDIRSSYSRAADAVRRLADEQIRANTVFYDLGSPRQRVRHNPTTKDEAELLKAYRRLDDDHKRIVRLAAGLK